MNNDLISREALKKTFEELHLHPDLIDLIDNAPSVDTYTIEDIQEVQENSLILGAKLAQRPQGEWNYIQAGMCVCPFCGAMPHKLYKNYCAKCGAELKGGADND